MATSGSRRLCSLGFVDFTPVGMGRAGWLLCLTRGRAQDRHQLRVRTTQSYRCPPCFWSCLSTQAQVLCWVWETGKSLTLIPSSNRSGPEGMGKGKGCHSFLWPMSVGPDEHQLAAGSALRRPSPGLSLWCMWGHNYKGMERPSADEGLPRRECEVCAQVCIAKHELWSCCQGPRIA